MTIAYKYDTLRGQVRRALRAGSKQARGPGNQRERRWCGEAVTEADERYEAMDGTAVHAECMEALLLETVGVEALAERMGYEHRREVEMDAERREGL